MNNQIYTLSETINKINGLDKALIQSNCKTNSNICFKIKIDTRKLSASRELLKQAMQQKWLKT